jgi:hypothetical protein
MRLSESHHTICIFCIHTVCLVHVKITSDVIEKLKIYVCRKVLAVFSS